MGVLAIYLCTGETMTDAELSALHLRWLRDIHDHNYDRAYTLNLWFSTVAELQGLSVGLDEMWNNAIAVNRIFSGLMAATNNFHKGEK